MHNSKTQPPSKEYQQTSFPCTKERYLASLEEKIKARDWILAFIEESKQLR